MDGRLLAKGARRPAGYWAGQLRSPVRFRDAVESAAGRARVVFVEVGPGTGLIGSVRQVPAARPAPLVALQPRAGELLCGAGQLWAAGVDLDWTAVRAADGGVRVALPTYPFARTRHWLDAPAAAEPVPSPVEPVPAGSGEESVLQQVIEIWRSMLGVTEVDAGSNFFALGGESLLFIRMVTRVRRTFGVPVEIADMVEAPTPGTVAAAVLAG
jgi:acyl transferase domain-containing protein